LTKNSGK